MGAYDNMFSNASTFKVELDEWSVVASMIPAIQTEDQCFQLQDSSRRNTQVICDTGWWVSPAFASGVQFVDLL